MRPHPRRFRRAQHEEYRVSAPPSARRRTAAALAALAGVSALLGPAAARAEDLAARYVALGDSFTAGPFIPHQYGDPALCLRSRGNYPNLVAEALGAAEFVDASCAGAESRHMTEPQTLALDTAPPQFDALTPDTTLVTVGIGGNDLGFGEIVLKCLAVSVTDLTGDPCRDHYTDPRGRDELAQRIPETGEAVGEVLAGIRERSPGATVAVVGYLELLPSEKGCLQVPYATGDIPYLYGVWEDLNAVIEKEAAEAGAVFVDASGPGHDMCAPRSERWVEGIFPTRPAAPVHPNADGMAEVGDRVLASLGVRAGSPLA
nr:SGNH/GDSL hydrolase family protein [Streptomonospora nanhaiensis]